VFLTFLRAAAQPAPLRPSGPPGLPIRGAFRVPRPASCPSRFRDPLDSLTTSPQKRGSRSPVRGGLPPTDNYIVANPAGASRCI